MNRRLLVRVVTAIAAIVFALGIWSTGEKVNVGWLKFFSAAVLFATAALEIWDRWIWRWRLVQRVPRVPLDLTGTWRGTLTSFWKDATTGDRPDLTIVFLVVRQSASHLSVVLLTNESSSRSSLAILAHDGPGILLGYIYMNRPGSRVEDRSRMHNGAALLEVSGRPANRVHGRYWTDRETRGELDFHQRVPRAVDDYQEAVRLFLR